MSDDFLLKNHDEQILDNYLKLLAFTAQKTNSDHAIMALKFENSELKQNSQKLRDINNSLINNHFNDLFDSEDIDVQEMLNTKIQQYLLKKTATGAKSLYMYKSGVGKISTMFK